ncbi:MAG: hypothetical protein U0Q12_12990 [Vicinamibacterales bacterium]
MNVDARLRAFARDRATLPRLDDAVGPSPRLRALRIGATVLAFGALLATSFWLSGASVYLSSWTGVGGRVAMLPGFRALGVASLLSVLALVVVLAIANRHPRPARRSAGELFAPLGLLGLLVLPYAPVVPDVFPVLMVFAGPLRWWVLIVTAVLVVERARLAAPTGSARGSRFEMKRRGLIVFAVSFGVFLALGTMVTRSQGVGGDEPHYLIITQSLLEDGDLRIENNHEQRDYAAYFGGDLRPDFIQRGRDGVIYSIHAPGLSAMLLPAFAVGGVRGALVFIAFLVALTAVAVDRIACRFGGTAAGAWTTVAICGSTPFLFHAWLIYPEVPAAAVVSWTLVWLTSALPGSTWVWCLRGTALGALPWLHTKFVTLAPLGLALAWRAIRERRWNALVAFTLPAAALTAGWFVSFFVMYGTFNPTAPYGPLEAMGYQLGWSNVPRGVLGLLFDQEYGLLPYAPIYGCAAVGVWRECRRRGAGDRTTADSHASAMSGASFLGVVALTVVAFVVSTTRYYMWWGGASVPARFLVPLLPCAAPFLARAFRASGELTRATTRASLTVTLLVTATLTMRWRDMLVYNDRDGSSRLLEWLDPSGAVSVILPSFLWEDWTSQLRLLAIWGIALVVSLAGTAWVLRRRALEPAAGATVVAIVGVAGLAVTGRLLAPPSTFDALVQRGHLRLLADFAPSAHRYVDLSTLKRLGEAKLLSLATIHLVAPKADPDEPLRTIGPVDLPAGRYAATVHVAGTAPDAPYRFSFHRSDVTIGTTTASGRQRRADLIVVPDFAPKVVWLGADDLSAARALRSLDLQPIAIVPREARAGDAATAYESLQSGPPGSYLAYLDRNAFPEHGVYWTRGESETTVVVATGGGSSLGVWVQAGAAPGVATVGIGSEPPRHLTLAAGDRREWRVALSGASPSVRVRVGFTAGFRPADVDPGSVDRRWLGCRIGLSVE